MLVDYQLILFDVDETLLDFAASEKHAMGICWEHYFKASSNFDVFQEAFRAINVQLWREVESGKLKPPQVGAERARRVLRHMGFNTRTAKELGRLFTSALSQVARWLPGAEAAFHAIAQRHKVGLVTNGLSEVQNTRIDALGIRKQLCAFQISEEAGTMKPRAEIFNRALQEAGFSKDATLMVGDSVSSDFQGAINAGLHFCWVKPMAHGLPLGFPQPQYHVQSLTELDSILSP